MQMNPGASPVEVSEWDWAADFSLKLGLSASLLADSCPKGTANQSRKVGGGDVPSVLVHFKHGVLFTKYYIH